MAISLLVLAVLLVFNALFAMSELAMMTSRPARLRQALAGGDRGAGVALDLAKHPTRFLSTVQVGITLIGILAGALGEREIADRLAIFLGKVEFLAPYREGISLAIVVVLITYVTLVFGELVPKRLALSMPEKIAARIARPLSMLSKATAFPVKILSASTEWIAAAIGVGADAREEISEEEVRELLARGATTGVFTPQEHGIFERVFRVGDLRVRSLMIPRADMVWLPADASPEDLRVLVGTSPYSHYPVCDGGPDKIIGVVHIKDLISYGLLAGSDFKISAVAQRPLFVPETMPALKLLDFFQNARTHLAFVVDEYGGVEGLVTLNDVMGSLLGDLGRMTETSRPDAIQRPDGSWLIDGGMGLHDAAQSLKLPEGAAKDQPDVSTVGGLINAKLGHLPTKGESVDWRGWKLEVVDTDGRRVDQVLAMRVAPASDQDTSPDGAGD